MKSVGRGVRVTFVAVSILLSAFILQAQDENSSFGWANYDGQTFKGPVTGGGDATPVEVTTFAQLKTAVESSDARVIHVMNDMGNGYIGTSGDVLKFKSNKTVIGVKAGITIKCSFQISGASNLIVRNLIIRGPGNSNSNQNWDAVNIQGSNRIWFDHCTVMEGEDGNFDVVKGSDNVTASWCKFTYVTGGEHNLSNLIGSSDNEEVSHDKLNVTYAYCWWDNVNSRCPRTRYGKIHVLNSYYNRVGSGAYAGYMSNVRVEGCFFESNVTNPTGLISTGGKAGVFTIDCNVNGTKKDGYNDPFAPPYQFTKFANSEVKSRITAAKGGAGATLDNPIMKYSLSSSVAQGQGTITPSSGSYESGSSVQITAVPAQGYKFNHWGGDLSGITNPATLSINANKTVTAYFVEDTKEFYTITKQASYGGSITQTPEGASLAEGTGVTFTAVPNSGWIFRGWSGDHTGENASYTIPSLSGNISISALFEPVDKLVYQAENGILEEAVVESSNAGFTGDGYVNFNASAASLYIPVYADEAGRKTVSIYYSNGSGSKRNLSLSVNGTSQIASIEFDATAEWTTWKVIQVSITLPKGASTITLETINSQDGPNVDKISLESSLSSRTVVGSNRGAEFSVLYNASSKTLHLKLPQSRTTKVGLFMLDGKRVLYREFTRTYAGPDMEIPLSGLKSGIYFVKCEADESAFVSKIINHEKSIR